MADLAPIVTARLAIVPFAPHHLCARYVAWLNDPEVVRYSEQRHRRHDEASCRTYAETMRASDDFFCAIEERARGIGHVGNMTVSVSAANGLADIAILLGEREVWGQGIGLEAWTGMMKTLLGRERLRKVTGGTVAANRAMVRIMEKAGMHPDGRRARHHLIDGQPTDVVFYAAFAEGAGL